VTRYLTWLFAVAGGAAVGNLYYAQPLLDVIGHDLHMSQGSAGLLVTATQLGYAAGIVAIVPLGDIVDRRRLIPVAMLASAVALLVCAAAPDAVVLAIALVAVGITTVSGQILAPFAGDLADDATRGRVVGVVVSGIVTGILVARAFSGIIAGASSWRVVFLAAAVVIVVVAVLIHRAVPSLPPRSTDSYRDSLRSVGTLIRTEPALRVVMALGAVSMVTFTMFWTALTFLLAAPPYDYSTTVIGLFGIAGLAGAVAAQGAGRLHDRGWTVPSTGAAWLLALGAWLMGWLGGHSVVWLLVMVVVFDAASQGQRILNQTVLFGLSTHARSRLNTAYVTGNFLGGALGSLLASVLWSAGGWNAVVGCGVGVSVAGTLLWAATRGVLSGLEPASSGPTVTDGLGDGPVAQSLE
jgi:predicted MFS family arabinose efflux permease